MLSKRTKALIITVIETASELSKAEKAYYLQGFQQNCPCLCSEIEAAKLLGISRSNFNGWKLHDANFPFTIYNMPGANRARALFDQVEIMNYIPSMKTTKTPCNSTEARLPINPMV